MTRTKGAATSSGRLAGKVAIISGGAAGMGAAGAIRFAEEGAIVHVLDINQTLGQAVADQITESGGTARFHHVDASDGAQVDAAFAAVVAEAGGVDVVFSHAGTIIVKPFHETTDAEYDRLMNINVRSSFLVCRAAVSEMLRHGRGGSIVITSSIGGEKGFSLESVYCMTKGAVLQLARSIAVEYRDAGIRANAVMPGFVKTAHGLREIEELDALGQTWEDSMLAGSQGRICEPEEVAAAALFLASDESSFVNGVALYVDNGWHSRG